MIMNEKTFSLSADEKNSLREKIAKSLEKREEVIFAYLYGSFLDGLPFHDIDVGVFLSGVSPGQATDFSLELGSELGAGLKIPVDVRVLNFAPVTFSYHVIRGELIVEKNSDTRCDFVEKVVCRYLDLKPRIRRAMKEAFGS